MSGLLSHLSYRVVSRDQFVFKVKELTITSTTQHISIYLQKCRPSPRQIFLFRSKQLPANLIQAQRDYFGAHTYELLAAPGKFVHTNWTGTGGNVSASTYSA